MSVLTFTVCMNVWRLPEGALHCRPVTAVRERNGTMIMVRITLWKYSEILFLLFSCCAVWGSLFSVWNFYVGQLFIAGNKLRVVKFLHSCICDVINVLKSTVSNFMLFILCIFLHSMLLTSTGKYITTVHRALFMLGAKLLHVSAPRCHLQGRDGLTNHCC